MLTGTMPQFLYLIPLYKSTLSLHTSALQCDGNKGFTRQPATTIGIIIGLWITRRYTAKLQYSLWIKLKEGYPHSLGNL
jgi:hypothetical protein